MGQVMNLHELSKEYLKKYKDKATDSVPGLVRDAEVALDVSRRVPGHPLKKHKVVLRYTNKVHKRLDKIKQAYTKMNEETLHELSKEYLKKYTKAAKDSSDVAVVGMQISKTANNQLKYAKQYAKRANGTVVANSKINQKMNEETLFELSKQKMQDYSKAAAKDLTSSKSKSTAAVKAHSAARDAHTDPRHPEVRQYAGQIQKHNSRTSKREKGLRSAKYLIANKTETSRTDRVEKLKKVGRAVAKKAGSAAVSMAKATAKAAGRVIKSTVKVAGPIAKQVAKGVIHHAAAGAAYGAQKARLKAGLTEGDLHELSYEKLQDYRAKSAPNLKINKKLHTLTSKLSGMVGGRVGGALENKSKKLLARYTKRKTGNYNSWMSSVAQQHKAMSLAAPKARLGAGITIVKNVNEGTLQELRGATYINYINRAAENEKYQKYDRDKYSRVAKNTRDPIAKNKFLDRSEYHTHRGYKRQIGQHKALDRILTKMGKNKSVNEETLSELSKNKLQKPRKKPFVGMRVNKLSMRANNKLYTHSGKLSDKVGGRVGGVLGDKKKHILARYARRPPGTFWAWMSPVTQRDKATRAAAHKNKASKRGK